MEKSGKQARGKAHAERSMIALEMYLSKRYD
jgi:hypothetical protein